MKTKIIIILIIGFAVSLYFNFKPEPVVPHTELHEAQKKNNAANDSLTKSLKEKDGLLRIDSLRLKNQKVITNKYKETAKDAEQRAYIAEARYEREKTIQNCDSALRAKNVEIAGKDSVIESIGAEAEDYSRIAYVFKEKNKILEEVIENDKTLLDKYKTYDDQYNYFIDWKEDHKFWVWLLRIKQ
jgi:aldehyde:ferredoxin oxidoreductase